MNSEPQQPEDPYDEGISESTYVNARDNYNAKAATYDRWSSWERPFWEKGLDLLQLQPGAQLFEVGYGTGQACEYAINTYQCSQVAGIDISEKMQQAARQRVPKGDFQCGDIATIENYENCSKMMGQYDAVFCSFCLEIFETNLLRKVVENMTKFLAPDGKICIVSMSKQGGWRLMQSVYEMSHARCPSSVDCRPIYLKRLILSLSDSLEIVEAHVLPMYGLSAEIVIAKRK